MNIGVGSTWRNAIRIRLWPFLMAGLTVPLQALAGNPASTTQMQAAQRVMAQFEALAGSPQNARSLVQGLRTGTEILLVSKAPRQRVSFSPATCPMGYGNIRKALAIAEQELATRGIARPTPEELKAVLMGGTVLAGKGTAPRLVRYSGVLPLRVAHMKWGEIAHALAISPVDRPSRMASGTATHRLAAL